MSSTLGRNEGEDIQIASRTLRIVGIVENSTALANLPNIFLTTEGAQQLVYGGQPLVASIGIRGTLEQVPPGLQGDRPGRRGRRPAATAEGRGQLDHDRRDTALGRRGADRRVGDLSLRARTPARLRGVQGDWRADRVRSWPGWPCRRSSSHCRPRRRRRAVGAARTDVPDAGRSSPATRTCCCR